MMPGETHSAAPGTAAGLSRCQGCASLQQNLNEYVEALITLKQKIINTDNLLTEYQKKCDELQFARRENSTLHHQVEQMLQKISPLQKCQEELGSLKAELEEKKSSLKLYQDTHQEYARVKEECLKTDAQKKKLEAKVKKLEEAAIKQIQDFKQLRNEKKMLEKEFKKTQERLDEFSKQKNEKELRHIGTQISSDSYGSIDRRKVKLLLKELWLCINTAHRVSGEGPRCVPGKSAEEKPQPGGSGEAGGPAPAAGSAPGATDMRTCLAELSMEIQGDFSGCHSAGEEGPQGPTCSGERQGAEAAAPRSEDDGAGLLGQGPAFDEDLQAAVDFFRLPPPLLSPVPSPPPGSLPALGSLPSALAPETYFGEYADSSDNDSAQRRNSAASVSEEDTPEAQDCFGSSRKTGSCTVAEKLKSHEAAQALSTLEVNKVTAVGFGTLTATLRDPSATFSLAREKHWAVSSQFTSDGQISILDEAKRQRAVREMHRAARTEAALLKAAGSEGAGQPSGGPARETDVALRKSDSSYSPLGRRPLRELLASDGKAPLSQVMGLPKSDFSRWTDEITSESAPMAVSDRLQELSRELEKEREATQRFVLGESPEPEEDAGDAMDTTGLDAEAKFPSSTSRASSVCRGPQTSPASKCRDAHVPTEAYRSGQKLRARTPGASSLRSEPPGRCPGGSDLGSSSPASSPELGASGVRAQSGGEVPCAEAVKGGTEVRALPHSVFAKAPTGGQCASQGPGAARPPGHSPFPPPAASPCGWIKGGFGFGESTSWRHSDVSGRGGEERLQAGAEREATPPQLQRAAPSSENRGPASQPEPAGDRSSSLGLRAAASLLPNQVSVITTRARPGRAPCTRPEPPRPHSSEPASAADGVGGGTGQPPSAAGRGADREGTAQKVEEVAAVKRTSPEVSTSWRKSDFDSPSDPLPIENAHCPANDKLSFFSENVPAQNEDSVTEPAVQEAAQEQGPSPDATNLDSFGTGVDTLPRPVEVAASGGCPVEEAEVPRGDGVRCGGEAQAGAQGTPSMQQSREEPLELPLPPPGGTSSGGPAAVAAFSSAHGRKDEETRSLPETSPPSPVHRYTGVREVAGSDMEVESKAPSGSEGEHEPEGAVGAPQQGAAEADSGDGGDSGDGAAAGGAAEPQPPVEVGCLASALLGCSISPLPEVDRLSTADMVKFLESCELRDYSSGDSVSECSSKETLNRETNEEMKQSETSGEQYGKQLCEQETLETCEEWVGSEDEDGPLRGAGQLAQCSLEALSEVLGRLGQEFPAGCEDPDGKDAASLLLLSIQDGAAGERAEEQVSAPEAAGSSPHSPGPPAPAPDPDAQGGSPAGGTSSDENTEDRPEGSSVAPEPVAGGSAAPSPSQGSDAGAEQAAGPGAGREAGGTLQCRISTVTSEVINVLINKDQNLVIEKGDNWTIINGVALVPNVDQVILCDAPADSPGSPGGGGLAAGFLSVTPGEKSPETSHAGSPFQEPPCGGTPPCPQEEISSSGQTCNFDKSRLRNRPVKPSVRISAEIYDQAFESQTVASDHTYYNSKLEPLGKTKPRAKIPNKDQASKPAKAASSRAEASPGEVSPPPSGDRGVAKPPRQQTQTVLANADTSTPTDGAADALSKIRQEVGPPLPPLLAPLVATPPRSSHPVSPLISSSSPSSPTSPVGQLSPLCDVAAPPVTSPAPEEPGRASPLCTSPSPSAAPAGERTLSSPLQFCAATPKHALPVPGRLPPCASAHTAVAGPQENSVKILDTMYPELSARARTLSILKGNIQLARGPPADRQNAQGPVSAITGFKAITSTSTAFVKTGGSSGGDAHQGSGGKRTLPSCTLRSAKRLRLDSGSPDPETGSTSPEGASKHPRRDLPQGEVTATEEGEDSVATTSADSQLPLSPRETVETHDRAIADALRKIAESSFDLLPVIRSHVYVGNISKKPVMRDEEKEVVYDFSTAKKHLAECLLHSILSELKLQKVSEEHSYIHALCRVYVGICRQLGDVERARLFCYSLLKEDFPESEKLTLFIANMWHDVFISQSVINKAMQLVARQRAKGEVLNCLRAFLNWEKNAPADVGFMVSKLLLTIQLCPKTEFQSSERFGEDLSDNTWEYIFAIDLLCCHQKWVWTHDNIISKELWPVMDKWIKHRKGHANIAYIPDVIIASILRLIGRLGQLGLKEGFPSAVRNISSVIGMFIQHAREEDIPWGIQLAAVYALCDLSPSNPAEISKILEAWRKETGHSVPSAVVSSLEEVSALCAEELG